MKQVIMSAAEIIQVEPQHTGALRVAEKRVTPIVRAWASFPSLTGLDLFWLAVSCYMQGTVDGYGAAERARRKDSAE